MNDYIKILQENNLKITPRRKAIIKIFTGSKKHLTPENVWKSLKKDFKKCGLPSVYRNLESLAKCGILINVQKSDNKKHYGLCTSCANHKHHHHITCIKCGKIEEIEDCQFENKKKIKGFKIVSHFMQINGICNRCSK